MRQTLVFVALSALSAVSAQTQNFTINVGNITETQRNDWCRAQGNSCELLCGGVAETSENICKPGDLTYDCTCSNGTAPGLQYYDQTIPSFVCQVAYTECNEATDNAQAQKKCKTDIQDHCGTLDPSQAQTGGGPAEEPSSSAAPSATQGEQSAPTSTSSRAAGPTIAARIGNGLAVAAAGVFAAALL